MIDQLDIRFGHVVDIRLFSDKPDSPRRKFCVIRVEFPGVGIRQSVGQFARHKNDLLGRTVLCLINVGSKNMFGQPSEILVMGLPHPDGGVISGDAHEQQATFLAPVADDTPTPAGDPKPQLNFDEWLAADLRLVEVIDQSAASLTVHASGEGERWSVALPRSLSASLVGQRIIAARDAARPQHGHLPTLRDGSVLLARPNDPRPPIGAKVY
ncbi:MAG: hypothetical protein JF606_22795 [Burkholderiales bacterium]|nr:hypothetical protein [Burkholderiales bacterium]